jgi:hypothetical protein
MTNTLQLPRRSFTNVRLINKHWAEISAVPLWHTFRIKSMRIRYKRLRCSQPTGFREIIREFHITGKTLNRNTVNLRPMHILAAIPPQQLTRVTFDYETDERTLGALIRLHPCLKQLSVPLASKNNTAPPGMGYVAGNLKKIEALEIFVNQDQKGYDVWLDHLSQSFERLIV